MKKIIFGIVLFLLFTPFKVTFADGGLELKQLFLTDVQLESIAWNEANTIVASGQNMLYVSNDNGKTWNEVLLEESIQVQMWDGHQFIAANSYNGELLVSKNGYDWESVFKPGSSDDYWWQTIEKVNNRYIASAVIFKSDGSSNEILESEDLRHWNEVKTIVDKSLSEDDQYAASIKLGTVVYTVATNGKMTLIGGHHGRMIYTNQNQQWVERPLTSGFPDYYVMTDAQKKDEFNRNGFINKIYWNGKEFIAIVNNVFSPDSGIYSSSNGVTWKQVGQLPPTTEVEKVIPTDIGIFVIGAAHINNSPYVPSFISFSTDYKNWSTHMFPIQGDIVYDAIWNGNELLAVGTKGVYQVKPTPEKVYFDFKKGDYWSDDMAWAIDNKLISGYKNVLISSGKTGNLLKPYNTLTEAQALTVMYRYFDPVELKNNNTSSSWWAAKAYQLANRDGLQPHGSVTSTNVGDSGITRGTFAKFIATKHFGEAVSIEDAIAFMYEAGITTGYPDETGISPMTFESYGKDKLLKRAHIVTFMKRYYDYANKH
ncbi:hypothetical protein EJF36_19120 [Bacillus sp. HMF5848]|uniref:hypothetical protein n=1 Tax=Bacillus sp. HMF5848 TaxID=2495421 RepID=UPI000F785238|nr:hypothetical protein [Bacillus sp. HMF5848]RSK28816.1 hypothetical protein EJF36_19120 [Bacillus sp. HMF5848]